MNKIVSLFVLALLVLSFTAEARIGGPYYSPGSEGQFYSVSFDAEGEATVIAKLVLTNYNDADLKNIKIEMPGKNIRLINVVQEWYGTVEQCVQYNPTTGECMKYQEYPDYQARYSVIKPKVTTLSESISVDMTLPQKVESQDQAIVLIYYKAEGFAENNNGVYPFDFETIKVPFDLQNTRVAITASNDLYLEGGQASVDYRNSPAPMASGAFAKAEDASYNSALQSLSNQVQYAEGYVKTAEGLDPLESFHVQGKYATSWSKLYQWRIIGSVAIGIAVLAALIFGVVSLTKTKNFGKGFGGMILTSVGSALLLTALFGLSWFLLPKFLEWFGYQYYSLMQFVYVILAFMIGLFILIGPGIYYGTQHGVGKGLAVVGMTLIFTAIFALILFGILSQLPNDAVQPPMPYYGGVAMRDVAAPDATTIVK